MKTKFNLQETIEKLAASHASAKKVGKKHYLDFASDLMAAMPKRGGGKPVSEHTKIVRDHMMALKGEYTARQVADKLGIDPVLVNATIKYMQKTGASVENIGKGERTSAKGKFPTVWKFGA